MPKRIIFLLLVSFIYFSTLYAESGEYDKLLNRSLHLPATRLMAISDSLIKSGHSNEAMVTYMIVMSRKESLTSEEDRRVLMRAFLNCGDLHYSIGNYSKALKCYVDGLKVCDSLPDNPADKHYTSLFYKNMGNVYNVFQNFNMGRHLYISALKSSRENGDSATSYKLLQNLSAVSMRLGDVAKAREYYDEMMKISTNKSEEGAYMEKFILALILDGEQRYEESITLLLRLAEETRIKGKLSARYECDAYDEAARIYLNSGDKDSAVRYMSKCLDIAEKSGILHIYANSLRTLFSIYEENGDIAAARPLKDKYMHMMDSIYNRQQLDAARNQQVLYEMEKTERTIKDLNERHREHEFVIHRQRIIMLATIVGIIIALLLLYYFYRQKKRLSESYRSLYQLNRELAATHKNSKESQDELRETCRRQRLEIEQMQHKIRVLSYQTEQQEKWETDDCIANAEFQPVNSKYQTSNLQDVQRAEIAEAVAAVMENGEEFTSPDFSLTVLANRVNSNVKYVSQVINDVYKKNFNSFVNGYRVRLACERLSDRLNYGNYTIRGIGESVGFKSHTTFISAFKKVTGMSPSVYQKLSEEENRLKDL